MFMDYSIESLKMIIESNDGIASAKQLTDNRASRLALYHGLIKWRTPEQLKGQIRHFATQRGLQPQEVLHMFYHMYAYKIDFKVLEEAIHRTARKRGSEGELKDWKEICEDMWVVLQHPLCLHSEDSEKSESFCFWYTSFDEFGDLFFWGAVCYLVEDVRNQVGEVAGEGSFS